MSANDLNDDPDALKALASLLDADDDNDLDLKTMNEANKDETNEEEIMKELRAAEERMAQLKAKLAACGKSPSSSDFKSKNKIFQPSSAPASGRTAGILEKPVEEFNKVVSRPLQGSEKEKLFASLAQKEAEALLRQDLADSDDDDTLNPYGADIKRKLSQHQDFDKPSSSINYTSFLSTSKPPSKTFTFQGPSSSKPTENDSYIESNSRIKITRPALSQDTLEERMSSRNFVSLTSVARRVAVPLEQEWVTLGVLTGKMTKMSAKGQTYSLWTLVDLEQSVEQTVSVLLFGSVHTTYFKTMVSSVIGMLNPNLLEPKPGQNGTMISVKSPDQLLVLGVAQDLGTCKGVRKNGEKCTMQVNMAKCPFCVYHVKNEYRKSASGRPEVQSSFSGTGTSHGSSLDRLKQKVLGKEGVMYGGKLFTPPPSAASNVRVNTKHHQKDRQRLNALNLNDSAAMILEQEKKAAAEAQAQALLKAAAANGRYYSESERKALEGLAAKSKGSSSIVELMCAPTAGSRNLLKHLSHPTLSAPSSPHLNAVAQKSAAVKSITPKELLQQHKMAAEKQKLERMQKMRNLSAPNLGNKAAPLSLNAVPSLGQGLQKGQDIEIDLELDLTMAKKGKLNGRDAAKAAALRLVREKGVIKAANPNDSLVKKRNPLQQQQIVDKLKSQTKAAEEKMDESTPSVGQKRKIDELDKWKAIIDAKSSHSNLIDEDELEREDRYFDQKEKAEQVETKMLNTFEVATTVVSCLQCKYTATSASQLCYEKGHTLKRSKGTKRFFHCKSCKYRCTTVARLPKGPCPKCNNTAWHKTGMICERKGPPLPSERLSLTGDEINHLNSVGQGKLYINL